MSTVQAEQAKPDEPRRAALKLYLWTVSVLVVILVGKGIASDPTRLASKSFELLGWSLLLMVGHIVPVHMRYRTNFASDLPAAVAAALVLAPLETAVISFAGAIDPRELKRQISPTKAVFNRSQVALTNGLGSLVVHAMDPNPVGSRMIVVHAFVALTTILIANYMLVLFALSLENRESSRTVLERILPGVPVDFLLAAAAWAVLGAMLAALYERVHPLALFAFVFPMLLGRQVLSRGQMFVTASRVSHEKERALIKLSNRIQEERTDERRLIAADLHDDVLQPLFHMSLLAEVVKRDLATGRLLELENDVPPLARASEAIAENVRRLIGELRRSSLGRGGLGPAIDRLARNASMNSMTQIEISSGPVDAGPVTELALYQIAKEALANAVTHSRASRIWIRLIQDDEGIALEIGDDGIGFNPAESFDTHYGLLIMRERAAAAGGSLSIDACPGDGCVVRVLMPNHAAAAPLQ